jgi:TolB protein
MRSLIIILIAALCFNVSAQNGPGQVFTASADIGDPSLKGLYSFDPVSQEYTLRGSGYNIWFDRDEFYYLFSAIKGDFILTANFAFSGEGRNPHRKIGWMVRESSGGKSPHISAVLHGNGLTVMQWRAKNGATMRDPEDEIFARDSAYSIIQIERKACNFTMRAAKKGRPLEIIGSHEMPDMPEEVMAGLFICSHDPAVKEEAVVWNVRIDRPVAEDYNPDKEGYLGCRLETINIEDFKRRIIYEKPSRFEAPNWMPDGKNLLFNMNGSLYSIPAIGGEPEKLNTGTLNNLNNDHGISFNGKLLAVSHHRSGLPGGGSTVYVLPLKGGKPKMVTENTPSYWHGWDPDNKHVIYVAQRNGIPIYNIYRNSIRGAEEKALTNIGKGEHVDGCEYSPDGKYIYYNGSRSGKMHIWRMRADGSKPEEISTGEYNDWFPHISPDGKWIVFISFPPEVAPNDHPSYKRVMLRLMPSSGGAPQTIAFLYGGQGSINVPSWSPDSREIAFVSNSGK